MLPIYRTWKTWNFKILKFQESSKIVEFETLNPTLDPKDLEFCWALKA
jgi:hypothetical protein